MRPPLNEKPRRETGIAVEQGSVRPFVHSPEGRATPQLTTRPDLMPEVLVNRAKAREIASSSIRGRCHPKCSGGIAITGSVTERSHRYRPGSPPEFAPHGPQ